MTAPTVVLRVAGLPASSLDRFSCDQLDLRAHRRREIEERLDSLRASLVDDLYREIGDQEPEVRSFLLTVKRACYNRRPVEGYASDPRWKRLAPALRRSLEEVVELERRLVADARALRELWKIRLLEERTALRGHVGSGALLRGLSLATQPLVERLPALGAVPGPRRDRKMRKLEQSLLRYLSRAAAKLSPYSTLTRAGLGAVAAAGEHLTLVGDSWRETSLLRARRYIVDQVAMVLAYSEAMRRDIRLRLNDTLEPSPAGGFQLLRPELLRRDEQAGQLRYVRMSLTRLGLQGPLVDAVFGVLQDRPAGLPLDPLVDHCLDRLPIGDGRRPEIERFLDGLLGAGVLLPVAPWTTDDVYLERAMAERLLEGAGGSPAAAVREQLADLVERQARFAAPGGPAPVAALREMTSSLHEVWDRSCRMAGSDLRLLFPAGDKYNFYEDVFVDSGEPAGAVARIGRSKAEALLGIGDALWLFADYYHPRRELLLSLDRLMEERWGDAARVPFLRVFEEAQSLWKDFVAFKYDRREAFDPLGSPRIAELREAREALRQELLALGESDSLDLSRLFALRERVPPGHRSPVGSCLFVQPLDREGERWVLNRLFEGSGRYVSRFTSAMPEPLRRRWLAHYVRRSRLGAGAGGAEIVDVLYGHENTVNLHYPQTRRVLVIPGETTRLPAHRTLHLGDLWVERSPAGGVPRIVDRRGRWCLPCHLSAMNEMYLPVVVKFLTAFAPSSGAGKAIFPWRTREVDGITVSSPIEAGPLVIRRRRWIVPSSAVPRLEDPFAQLLALERWRAHHGIPRRVFLIEKIDENETGRPVYKPQYIDFSSPLLVEIFCSGLEPDSDRKLTLEEALPTPDAYPPDAAGERWALELVLEGLSLPALGTSPQPLQVLSLSVPEGDETRGVPLRKEEKHVDQG